jgi:phospholipase B1
MKKKANDIPTQAASLVKQMKESKEVDFDKDWKLITLFIGGNDLCRYDQNKELHGPTAYINDIINGIDILFNEVPRAFINLVTVLDAGQVRELNKGIDFKNVFLCTLCSKY